ncbi:hypothetical protein STEG23_024053, partial [Scotinomys teguina]
MFSSNEVRTVIPHQYPPNFQISFIEGHSKHMLPQTSVHDIKSSENHQKNMLLQLQTQLQFFPYISDQSKVMSQWL